MEKILLVGNPNVGKSTIFSRLTGAKVLISNYPGTTVEFSQGHLKLREKQFLIIDVPGIYSLEPTCEAEEVAVRMLKEGTYIINIVDATNLERNLYLTLELLEKNIPTIIALNMWDDTKHKGITIDIKNLEKQIGVPVVPTCGLTNEGIKELIDRLTEAKANVISPTLTDQERWKRIGKIIEASQKLTHRHHTFLERLQDLSVKPQTGLPIAIIIIYCAFWFTRLISEGLINYFLDPLFQYLWHPLMMKLSFILGENTFLHHILIGELYKGEIIFYQSFGLLTTGLYVPIAMVLPYIFSFYLTLGFIEDFGYLPRFAVMMDPFMHRIGLHGYAIIPFTLGMGCNVPGVLALRILEERRERFISATLMVIAVPCMAQTAVIVGLVGQRGGQYVAIVFITLFTLFVIKGLLLNRVLKGTSPEILIPMPPYRIPQFISIIKKLWIRLDGFLREAIPLVLLGILFINILYTLKIIDLLAFIFSPILNYLWGLPDEAISALIVGFLRKDMAVGMLGPLNLTTKQLVIGSTVLAMYFPCIATYMILIKELGVKDMIKIMCIMLLIATAVGTILNLIL